MYVHFISICAGVPKYARESYIFRFAIVASHSCSWDFEGNHYIPFSYLHDNIGICVSISFQFTFLRSLVYVHYIGVLCWGKNITDPFPEFWYVRLLNYIFVLMMHSVLHVKEINHPVFLFLHNGSFISFFSGHVSWQ